MPFFDAAMVLAANAVRGAVTHLQLHSGAPGTAGTTNVTTAARRPVTWSAATADGDFGLSATVAFTGGAASGACTYVTLWSALTGGTCYGSFALTGDATFNAAGEYNLTALNINGSAS